MLTFCFLNVYLGHAELSTPVVTDSSMDGRGQWVPSCDDRMLLLRLGMAFDRVGDCPELYNRYAVYVGFSVHSGHTGKNKAGKYWKSYVCSKEGFHRPDKMSAIATLTAEAMPQARDDPKGGN